MFPTASSTVYRNEAGEPIGWSDESYYKPDVDDFYDNANHGPYDDCAWFCNACGCWGDGVDGFQGKRKITLSSDPIESETCPDCGEQDLDY